MEKVAVLRQVVESANTVLNAAGDMRAKQKDVQQIMTDVEMSREPFECIFSELDDDMDETELESYLEVWKVEATMAAQDAEKELQCMLNK